jgi:hypothetical protein
MVVKIAAKTMAAHTNMTAKVNFSTAMVLSFWNAYF